MFLHTGVVASLARAILNCASLASCMLTQSSQVRCVPQNIDGCHTWHVTVENVEASFSEVVQPSLLIIKGISKCGAAPSMQWAWYHQHTPPGEWWSHTELSQLGQRPCLKHESWSGSAHVFTSSRFCCWWPVPAVATLSLLREERLVLLS